MCVSLVECFLALLLTCCRFRLVHRMGQACTALACCVSRPTEVLVGLADHSVLCIDTGQSDTGFVPPPLSPSLPSLTLPTPLSSLPLFLFSLLPLSLPLLPPLPDSGERVATLRGHEASVKSLSLHSSGRHVLAVSSQDCVLWDLDGFTRCRTLNGGQEVGVQDVSSASP